MKIKEIYSSKVADSQQYFREHKIMKITAFIGKLQSTVYTIKAISE